jgi:class 3 adenylate cyclase/tetratricopeptide (TPR) repeat protein
VPQTAHFCPECGRPQHAPVEERRVATVLFADLVGFTAFSEGRDPEQVKGVLDRRLSQLTAAVTAYGGWVDKIVGDALVALFGAPVAHEDDAERAVRAALQMQQTIKDQATVDFGSELSLRIGINSGEVLVGAPRSGEYTALGDVVNVASRLETMAGPGQVIVGPGTWAATRDTIRYVALGPVQTRGREEMVEAWLALEAMTPPGYRPRRSRSPLFGRDEELMLVTGALTTCIARKRAHLVLLFGEAGVGKSRLAEELARAARRDHGATVVGGRCVPYGDANAWWPVAEALRRACGITPSDTAEVTVARCQATVADATGLPPDSAEVGRLVDGLLHVMGDESRLADIDPVRKRDEERRSVLVLFEALARHRPLVLVVSELHWADDTVLDTLDPLLDGLGSLPFLLVATARPELRGRWRPQAGRHNTVALTLDPLDERASAQLLASLLEGEPPAEVREVLLERSGGNPFFLEELASLVLEQGVDATSPGELPATLRGLVAARLDTLAGDERAVADDAAVIGRTGSVDGLYALDAPDEVAHVADALHRLVVKDVLAVDGGEFAFRSDLMREVAYETLTKGERARRHFRLAEWQRTRARELKREDEELEQVAHHLLAAARIAVELGPIPDMPADVAAQAVEALRRAAQRAEQRGQHHLAVRRLDEAASLISDDIKGHRDLLLARASAKAAADDLAGARADLSAVRALAEDTHDTSATARALIVQGDIEQREGRFAAAADTLARAAEALRGVGDEAGVAEAVRRAGMALLVGGDTEAAEAPIREALAASRRLGLRRDEAWALQNLAWIAFNRGQLDAAERRLHESLLAFADTGDYGGLAWARGLLGWVRFRQGDLDDAETLAVELLDEVDPHGDRWAHAMMGVLLADVRLWRGATADAVQQAVAAFDEFEAMDDEMGRVRAAIPLVRGLFAMGRTEEGSALLGRLNAPRSTAAGPDRFSEHAVTLMSLNAAVQLGDVDRAAIVVPAVTSAVLSAQPENGEATTLLGLVALQAGDPTGAVARVRAALTAGPPPSTATFARSALALALAAAGQPAGALAEAAEVQASARATYQDRAIAWIAAAFAHLQLGDDVARATSFERADAVAAGTGDLLLRFLVDLARTRADMAVDTGTGAGPLDEAAQRLIDLGVPALGWITAFGLAAGPARADRETSPALG